ncbi:MAG TPA: hypothetical protein VK187_04355 [Geobacteraceae bacterium]|nr:hypothetical protein [Geobacteraceae bacterium]
MLIKGLLRTLLCMALLSATTAWAAEIHGRSSTQFVWFDNVFNDSSQTDIAQYLQLSITKIDQAGKFTIYGYGRGTQDLSNGEGMNGRLYYLYGDYRDLFDKIDLRFGRQFVNIAAGNAIIDGGQIGVRNIGPVALTVLGGRNVIFGLTVSCPIKAIMFSASPATWLVSSIRTWKWVISPNGDRTLTGRSGRRSAPLSSSTSSTV